MSKDKKVRFADDKVIDIKDESKKETSVQSADAIVVDIEKELKKELDEPVDKPVIDTEYFNNNTSQNNPEMQTTDESIEHDDNLEIMDSYVDILNVFLMYYQKLYNKTESLFQDVNNEEEESTNRSLELLYEFITTHKENEKKDPSLIEVYKPDDVDLKKYDTMYGLLINSDIEKVSPSILSLLGYVSTIDWCNVDWKITSIKNT